MKQELESINHKITTCTNQIDLYQSFVEKYKKDGNEELAEYFTEKKMEYYKKRRAYEMDKKVLLKGGGRYKHALSI